MTRSGHIPPYSTASAMNAKRGMQEHCPQYNHRFVAVALFSKSESERQSAMLRALEMLPRSNSSSYRARAAVSAWCAEQTASAEAAAALLYLEQMWLLVADVAQIIEGNGSRAAPDGDLHYLSRE
jgi:hypothetical protein